METWKAVVGFEGIYEVSDAGRVRRIADWRSGRSYRTPREAADLNPNKLQIGYLRVSLYANQTRKDTKVHQIVLAAFLGPPPIGCEVNHKNGKKDDNRLENLEYVSKSENQQHYLRVLGSKALKGSAVRNAKLTEEKVLAMRALRRNGWMNKDIAAKFGINKGTCSDILNHKLWRHV